MNYSQKLLPVLLLAGNVSAQEPTNPKSPAPVTSIRKHDIGVFAELGRGFLPGSSSNVGLMFRRARKKDDFLWYRLGVGYGINQLLAGDHPQYPPPPDADTFTQIMRPQELRLTTAIAGIEVQRHFIDNHLYFFAGAEVRGGYGWGRQDSSVNTSFTLPGGGYGSTTSIYPVQQDTKLFQATFALSVGARVYFNRFQMGLELLTGPTYTMHKTGDLNYGSSSFEFGRGMMRYSLGYRF